MVIVRTNNLILEFSKDAHSRESCIRDCYTKGKRDSEHTVCENRCYEHSKDMYERQSCIRDCYRSALQDEIMALIDEELNNE
jgi:hypothetical protein